MIIRPEFAQVSAYEDRCRWKKSQFYGLHFSCLPGCPKPGPCLHKQSLISSHQLSVCSVIGPNHDRTTRLQAAPAGVQPPCRGLGMRSGKGDHRHVQNHPTPPARRQASDRRR